LVALAAVGGCGPPAERAPRVGYARLAALAALHPSCRWASALDEWALMTHQAARDELPELPAPIAHSFLPVRGGDLEPPPVQAVLARVEQVIGQELARLAEELDARAQEQLARRARVAEREARGDSAQRRTELVRKLARERRQVLLDMRTEVHNVRLRVANLGRELDQVKLTPAARARAQERQQDLREQLAEALRRQSSRLDAVRGRYEAEFAGLQQAADERASREVAEQRRLVAAQVREELAGEHARLTAPLAAAAEQLNIALELPSAQLAEVVPGAVPEDFARASQSLRSQWGSWASNMATSANDLARRRRELMALIEDDTRATAETLARAHHWRIIWTKSGRAGETDITQHAEGWLRAHWGA